MTHKNMMYITKYKLYCSTPNSILDITQFITIKNPTNDVVQPIVKC